MENIILKMEELKLEIDELKKEKPNVCTRIKDNFFEFINKNIN